MSGTIRILIADDHLVFRMGLKSLIGIEPGFALAGEARSGGECVEMHRALRPDVVLLDLRMPDGGGLAALSKMRAEDPQAKVLMLTSYCTEEEVYQAVKAGARGYVLKDIGQEELADAVRAVHDGRKCIPPEIASRLAERLPREALNPKELETLKLVTKGLFNREICRCSRRQREHRKESNQSHLQQARSH